MMHSISIDVAAWDSPWRQHHVGAKIFLSLGLVLTALVTPAWPGCVLVAAISATAMLACARIPARVVGWSALAPVSFLVLGAVVVAITLGPAADNTWVSWGWLSIGPSGVQQAASLFAHGMAGTLAVLVLATTTPLVDLLEWLRSLGVPAPLLDIASLTYRLLFVTLTTVFVVHEAMRNRLGDDPLGARQIHRRWHHLAALVGSVGLRSFHRATRLNAGLELRGFEDDLTTLPRRVPWSKGFIIATIAVIASTLLLSWGLA